MNFHRIYKIDNEFRRIYKIDNEFSQNQNKTKLITNKISHYTLQHFNIINAQNAVVTSMQIPFNIQQAKITISILIQGKGKTDILIIN